jgi:hypothetical protein
MSNDNRIGNRFSASEFARLGLDSEAAAVLALELEQAVGEQVFVRLKQVVQAIVQELNELGHSLSLDEEQIGDPLRPIGISFRDEAEGASGVARCKLRLAFDVTVSAGYAHLDDDLEEVREHVAARRARSLLG